MSITPDDLLEVLRSLTVEQRISLADSLPIPSWQPGTTVEAGTPGEIVDVLLDRDLATGTNIQAKNITGTFIPAAQRVLVRKDGAVLQIDGVMGGSGLPAGILVPYGGATEPPWGVFGQGQSVQNSGQYARLGAAFGETGSTFTVPDVRGRVALFLTSETLRSIGGSMAVIIDQTNLPDVDFNVTDPGHAHEQRATDTHIAAGGGSDLLGMTFSGGNSNQETQQDTESKVTGITVNSGGSGTELDTTPACVYVNGVWTL